MTCIATLFVVGCGSSSKDAPKLDMKKVETYLSQDASARLDTTISVQCPKHVERAKGKRFACVATTINAIPIPLEAKQRDAKGNVTWHMDARTTDEIETDIVDGIKQQKGREVSVICPDVIPYDDEGTFTCVVGDRKGNLSQVVVTQTDDRGSVTWTA